MFNHVVLQPVDTELQITDPTLFNLTEAEIQVLLIISIQ